jgi:hypothetical protein
MLSFVPSENERVLDLPDTVQLSEGQSLHYLRTAAEQPCLSVVPPDELYEMDPLRTYEIVTSNSSSSAAVGTATLSTCSTKYLPAVVGQVGMVRLSQEP